MTADLESWDTTIYNYGTISKESEHSVKIVYAQPPNNGSEYADYGTIHACISKDWTFYYPGYTAHGEGNEMSGEIYDNGTIHIVVGLAFLGRWDSTDITGIKQ
jgi:hypothetical protein